MTESSFSYQIFWDNPLLLLTYFALAMGIVSLWIKKTPWLFGPFFLIAIILAFQTQTLSWLGLLPLGLLCASYLIFAHTQQKATGWLLFGLILLLSSALNFHFFPGFHNWQILPKTSLSEGSLPYTLYLNFDKPWMGIFPLVLAVPLLSSKTTLLQTFKKTLPLTLAGIVVMILLAYGSGLVQWDVKVPWIFLIWFVDNLIFAVIPEEAFFRGFVQRELKRWFGETTWAAVAGIFLSSLLFLALHLIWVTDIAFLSLVFVASLIYGVIYEVTRSIEASIFCHFGLNLVHFLLFSYPMSL